MVNKRTRCTTAQRLKKTDFSFTNRRILSVRVWWSVKTKVGDGVDEEVLAHGRTGAPRSAAVRPLLTLFRCLGKGAGVCGVIGVRCSVTLGLCTAQEGERNEEDGRESHDGGRREENAREKR